MANTDDVSSALLRLAQAIRAHNSTTRFSDHWTWQAPPVTSVELAIQAESLAERFAAIAGDDDEPSRKEMLTRATANIEVAVGTTAPNLFSGPQASEAISILLFTTQQLADRLTSGLDLRALSAQAKALERKASAIDVRLDAALQSVDSVGEKLAAIESAYQVAEDLPITKKRLSDAITEAARLEKQLLAHEIAANKSSELAGSASLKIAELAKDANKYLENIQASYQAVTSQGLAQAFHDRQRALNQSMLIWVLGLIAALAIAALIGTERFPLITVAANGNGAWGSVIVNMTLAAFSIAPAAWFAWIATKQIGQRFRLAEDYAFKASISAAYEGYRAEAARLDPLLEAQLFASALSRLDELPLRLIEKHVSGSPLQDLLKAPEFKQAIETVPGFMDRVLLLLKREPVAPKRE